MGYGGGMVLLHTMWYCWVQGVLEGYWSLEVLGVLWGTARFCEVLLGNSWVLGGIEG